MADQKPKGKGGRPPKSEAGLLSKNLYFRVRPALFEQLQECAHRASRSISEEVEYRLTRSLQREAAVAEMFGTADQAKLIIALGNVIRLADSLSDGPGEDNILQAYASVIATVQGLARRRASDVLKDASEKGLGWRKSATSVIAMELQVEKEEAASLIDPMPPQLPPRTAAALKKETTEAAVGKSR